MKIFAQMPDPGDALGGMFTMPTAGGGESSPSASGGPSGPPPSGGGGGGGGAEGGPRSSTFKIIYSPLDNLGKILADLDIKSYLQGNFGDDPDQLAHKIWVMYGGAENELSPGKKGERQDKPISSDPVAQQQAQEQEYNNTRNARWKRLPLGVSIEQITSPESISLTIRGGFENLSKMNSKPAQSATEKWLKLATKYDSLKRYKDADWVDKILKCLLT
jgi:hypothetical protein